MARIRRFGVNLQVDLIQITPEIAEKWIGQNTHNRRSRDRKITQYAEDMQAGRWNINGETIIFANTGRLLDGQNRLLAIIEGNTPMVSLVVRGVADATQETMDTGAARTLADTLRLRRETNVYVLASALRKCVAYERTGVPYGPRHQTSNNQALEFLNRHGDLRRSVTFSSRRGAGAEILQKTDIAALHFLFSVVDEDIATDFFEQIGSGAGLAEDSPIFTLRNRMLRERASDLKRVPPIMATAFIVKAFNAFYNGDRLMQLTWRVKEPFPRIVGSDNVLTATAVSNESSGEE
jgi:hypothetical protein